MTISPADLARQLAARRPRAQYHCFQCGRLFEATIQRGTRAPTTCSPKCRQARHRQTKQQKIAPA